MEIKSLDSYEDGELRLVDLETVPLHMQNDYYTRNENVMLGNELCTRCDGTGNELYSMYCKCGLCGGKGKTNDDKI